MKKVVALVLFSVVIYTNSFSQNIESEKKYINKSMITKKPYKALVSEDQLQNKDSTIGKSKNGFDIKRSKVDNMDYVNTNKENIASKRIPISKSASSTNMPTRKLPLLKERFLRDTTFNINGNIDSSKKW